MSELRHDPLTDRWVVISTERASRPSEAAATKEKKKSEFCPFCPGNEDKTPIPEIYMVLKDGSHRSNTMDINIIKNSEWLVRVIPNKYPALQPETILKRKGVGVYDKISGAGAHEIFIESREHDIKIHTLPLQQVVTVLNVIKLRMSDLEKDPRFRYLSLFKNEGEDAGASLEHGHFQLTALPITPSEVARELNCCRDYFNNKERCLICDILSQEVECGERIVEANEAFMVLAPFASRFAGELFVAPSPEAHHHNFPDIDDKMIEALASVIQRTLARLSKKYDNPPYNITLHTAPFFRRKKKGNGETIQEDYHWHFHIMPRIGKIAGFELGNDCFINIFSPEEVAKLLREAAV